MREQHQLTEMADRTMAVSVHTIQRSWPSHTLRACEAIMPDGAM